MGVFRTANQGGQINDPCGDLVGTGGDCSFAKLITRHFYWLGVPLEDCSFAWRIRSDSRPASQSPPSGVSSAPAVFGSHISAPAPEIANTLKAQDQLSARPPIHRPLLPETTSPFRCSIMSSTQPTPRHGEDVPKVMGPPMFHQQKAREPPGLRALAALSQPAEVPFVPAPIEQLTPFHQAPATISHGQVFGASISILDAPSQFVPPILANPSRKRKAPTLRAADWEPMKNRITELWTGNEKYTIPRLEETLRLEFGFTAT